MFEECQAKAVPTVIHPQKCPHSRRGFLQFSNHAEGSPHTPTGLKGCCSLPFFNTFPSPSENPSGLCPTWGKGALGENPPCSAKSFPPNGGSQWGHLGMCLAKPRAGLGDAPQPCPGLCHPTVLVGQINPLFLSPLRSISALGMLIVVRKLMCSLPSLQRPSLAIAQPGLWHQGSACPCPSVGVPRLSLPVAPPIGNTQPKVLEQPCPGSVQTPPGLVWGLGDALLGQGQAHVSHLSWPD